MTKHKAHVPHHEATVQKLRESRVLSTVYAHAVADTLHSPEVHDSAAPAYGRYSRRIDGKVEVHYAPGKQLWRRAMTALTVTAKGQVTLKRDLLQHLGIEPGGRIAIEKLPNGELRVRAARPTGTVEGFIGLLAGKTKKVVSIEEMNDAAASGWAGKK